MGKKEILITLNNLLELIKKTIVMFLLFAMVFNVIIPKMDCVNNSFTEALTCAVIAQTSFIDKYADGVIKVTNKMAISLLIALNKAGLFEEESKEKEGTNQDNRKSEPVNSSTENGIIIGNNTNNQNGMNILKEKIINTVCFCNDNLNIVGSLNVNCRDLSSDIGILFFILFSILVVRIKDTIALSLNTNNKKYKNKPAWLV